MKDNPSWSFIPKLLGFGSLLLLIKHQHQTSWPCPSRPPESNLCFPLLPSFRISLGHQWSYISPRNNSNLHSMNPLPLMQNIIPKGHHLFLAKDSTHFPLDHSKIFFGMLGSCSLSSWSASSNKQLLHSSSGLIASMLKNMWPEVFSNTMSLQMSVWTQIYIIEEDQMANMIEIEYILEPQNNLTAFLKEIKIEQFEIIQVVICFTKS